MRDATATVSRLRRLKDIGVMIAIDDFGTGYSSLAYLRQFPVDVLKIDRSFVAEMDGSSDSAALIHTLVELGRTLGLVTLAEGIEETAQLEVLRDEQCDSGQGFIFSRPVEPAAIEALLAQPPTAVRSTAPLPICAELSARLDRRCIAPDLPGIAGHRARICAVRAPPVPIGHAVRVSISTSPGPRPHDPRAPTAGQTPGCPILRVEGTTSLPARHGEIEVVVSRIGVGPSAARASTERLFDRPPGRPRGGERDRRGNRSGLGHRRCGRPRHGGGRVQRPEVSDISTGQPRTVGHGGTVDELINDPVRLAGLVDDGVVALEMESSGVGEVCDARGIPWSVVRVISDRPNDGLTDDAVMAALRPDGSVDVLAALRVMAVKPSRIPGFMQLGRDASMAARKAAATTLAALR